MLAVNPPPREARGLKPRLLAVNPPPREARGLKPRLLAVDPPPRELRGLKTRLLAGFGWVGGLLCQVGLAAVWWDWISL
ncbi:hypothetical protein GCM10023107_36870 [Actinoplanes octamycinicus]|nr:hypothetical protein Aoc01nite_30070 [Actinoplanes octamycinicus]